jgi:glycosyltransferase involved in cell wall biosynthesis
MQYRLRRWAQLAVRRFRYGTRPATRPKKVRLAIGASPVKPHALLPLRLSVRPGVHYFLRGVAQGPDGGAELIATFEFVGTRVHRSLAESSGLTLSPAWGIHGAVPIAPGRMPFQLGFRVPEGVHGLVVRFAANGSEALEILPQVQVARGGQTNGKAKKRTAAEDPSPFKELGKSLRTALRTRDLNALLAQARLAPTLLRKNGAQELRVGPGWSLLRVEDTGSARMRVEPDKLYNFSGTAVWSTDANEQPSPVLCLDFTTSARTPLDLTSTGAQYSDHLGWHVPLPRLAEGMPFTVQVRTPRSATELRVRYVDANRGPHREPPRRWPAPFARPAVGAGPASFRVDPRLFASQLIVDVLTADKLAEYVLTKDGVLSVAVNRASAATLVAGIERTLREPATRAAVATTLAESGVFPVHTDCELLAYAYRADPSYERAHGTLNKVARRHDLRLASRILEQESQREPGAEQRHLESFPVLRGVHDRARALRHGIHVPRKRPQPAYEPVANSVAMVLHHCPPFHTNGYATRSHAMLVALDQTAFRVEPIARPGYPWDEDATDGVDSAVVGPITYRFARGANVRLEPLGVYIEHAAQALEAQFREQRPAIVHAASSFHNAFPALFAARRLGLPFVYEARGFWELSAAANDATYRNSDRYLLQQRLDTLLACHADLVITLTEGMRRELIQRGVPAGKVRIASNSVDEEAFQPVQPDAVLASTLGLTPGIPTIGYIGSFVAYEGLDDLIRAAAKLRDQGLRFNVLLVGDGRESARLTRMVKDASLQEVVRMPGRAPHERIAHYYALIDVFAFPRKPFDVCELVSPLKPFEAMAMGKAVVASDVQAMAEYIVHDVNGLLFTKGNATSLAQQLSRLLESPKLREDVAREGQRWVRLERTWRRTAASISSYYEQLLAMPAASDHVLFESARGAAQNGDARPLCFDGGNELLDLAPRSALRARVAGAPGDCLELTGNALPALTDANVPLTLELEFDGRPLSRRQAKEAGLAWDGSAAVQVKGPSFTLRFRWPEGVREANLRISTPGHKQPVFVESQVRVRRLSGMGEHEHAEAKIQHVDRLVVAAILDRFSHDSFAPDCELLTFGPDDWERVLSCRRPHMLLVESAWEGNERRWHRRVGRYSDEEFSPLVKLTQWCRAQGIPTVFFNKEDPVHFQRFAETAKLFDHIFTTDEHCIKRYWALRSANIKSVSATPFAAQPSIHHPLRDGLEPRTDSVCFGGTYYAGQYPDRCAEMDMLLDAAAPHGLAIYDRQAGRPDVPYHFPERFQPFVHGGLSYDEMLDAYRRHRVVLNVNSVRNSHTMFSRRVFEAAASGAVVVSGPSVGVELMFGGSVAVVSNREQARRVLDRVFNDRDYRIQLRRKAARTVLRNHTCFVQLQKMARVTGTVLPDRIRDHYTVVLESGSPAELLRTALEINAQTRTPDALVMIGRDAEEFPNKDLITQLVCGEGMELTFARDEAEAVRLLPEYAEWVAKASPRSFYDEGHFEDLLAALQYRPVDVVGVARDSEQSDDPESLEFRSDVPLHAHASIVRKRLVQSHGFATASETTPFAHKLSVMPGSFATEREPIAPRTILLAGHDFKFFEPIARGLEAAGHRVIYDRWRGHDVHDEGQSRSLLAEADVIICEWCLGNAVWYSHKKRADQSLFVRFHAQELGLDFLHSVRLANVERLVFVSHPMRRMAAQQFGLRNTSHALVIPNFVNVSELDKPKLEGAEFRIGMVGIVPRSKRFDIALDVLARVRREDARFQLFVRGKRPEDYPWMAQRTDEMEYYDALRLRIANDENLRGAVHFEGFGDDMDLWYQKIGFVLSPSDHESFHLSVADGAASRAVPIVFPWQGADEIYPASWVYADVEAAAHAICTIARDGSLAARGQENRAFIVTRYAGESVVDAWLSMVEESVRRRTRKA